MRRGASGGGGEVGVGRGIATTRRRTLKTGRIILAVVLGLIGAIWWTRSAGNSLFIHKRNGVGNKVGRSIEATKGAWVDWNAEELAQQQAHLAGLRGDSSVHFNYDIQQFKDTKQIPPIFAREDLALLLEHEGHHTGAELGVLRGGFSRSILSQWPSATEYLLVDAWEPLTNYEDHNNIDKDQHILNYRIALARTEQWRDKIIICKNFTFHCAQQYRHRRFDFVYVDARHDYKGVLLDLEAWWPLVADGGIMAGHDYVYQREGPTETNQNWTVNYDGTVDPLGRAVKGAVQEFFNNKSQPERMRTIFVTTMKEMFPTWMVRK